MLLLWKPFILIVLFSVTALVTLYTGLLLAAAEEPIEGVRYVNDGKPRPRLTCWIDTSQSEFVTDSRLEESCRRFTASATAENNSLRSTFLMKTDLIMSTRFFLMNEPGGHMCFSRKCGPASPLTTTWPHQSETSVSGFQVIQVIQVKYSLTLRFGFQTVEMQLRRDITTPSSGAHFRKNMFDLSIYDNFAGQESCGLSQ